MTTPIDIDNHRGLEQPQGIFPNLFFVWHPYHPLLLLLALRVNIS